MATTIRGNSGGREKRGTSPSSSLTKKSPKPSSQNQSSAPSSSSLAKEKILLTTDKKPVPNYLKSTVMGSKLDSTSKRSTADLAQKPSPIRRRSFDRPPPISEVQRAIRSGPGTPREVKPSRSTSFSHRPGSSSLSPSSTRVVSDRTYARTTSSLKEGKLDSNLSKTLSGKKSTVSPITPLMKKGMNGLKSASSTKKAPKSVTSESSIDHDDNDNPKIDQLGLEDDLVSMDIEVQSLPEMSEMPDSNQELGDPITFIDRDVKLVEDLQDNITASEEQDLTVEGQTEVHTIDEQSEKQSEEKDMIVELEQQHPTVEEQHPTVDEEQNLPVEEKHLTVEEHNPIVEERNMTIVEPPATVEEQNPTPEEQNPTAEEQKLVAESDEDDKVAKNVEHGITELAKEKKEEEEEEAPAAKDENSNVKSRVMEPSKAQTGVGKKDKQAYNDVIEETASKLMGGKKKNKVLALAGAFETVISLQDTAKK
ncbi:uncharacterized protein LOC141600144 [Silene latifolia]|uniref:uncharacterized protein LOC141600144 n=1 Tax=Silene latifolia TaxID=37657 RepID=UPI003D774894